MKPRGTEERHGLPGAMVVTFALFGTLPLWIEHLGLYRYLGGEILIWCLFALGFNLLLGYTGLPSFGHGAYFGIGAYAMGLTQFRLVESLWIGLLAATLAGALVGGAVAVFISHRRGIYFALMTIAFGQMFFFIASKWTSVTGGEDGLLNIRRLPADFGVVALDLQGNLAFSYFVFAAFAVATVLLWRLVHSPFGKVLRAIKQNETRMAYLGYRVFVYKWASFTLSCAVAGFAGGLFAMAQNGAYVQAMSRSGRASSC
jgi:branched-chain amino acid transport system permease protein